MEKILRFGHRVRLTAFTKQLLELPCMQADAFDDIPPPTHDVTGAAACWRERYAHIANAEERELVRLMQLQRSCLNPNYDDEDLDAENVPDSCASATSAAPVSYTHLTLPTICSV